MKKYQVFTLGLIVVISLFVRIYATQHRWGFAYDQAHDYLVARYAVQAHKIPLVGPFSSVGAFQTGGQWYWIVMSGIILFPFVFFGPWVFMAFWSVAFVVVIMRLAYEMNGYWLALIAGILALLSPAQVAQSVHLTNQSPLALISLLAIWAAFRYVTRKTFLSAFFFGFFVMLSPLIHLSGALLFVFALFVIVFSGMFLQKSFFGFFFGSLISLLPILFYEIRHDFYNAQELYRYMFIRKNPITYELLGRRWLTYLVEIVPRQLGRTATGENIAGVLVYFAAAGISIYEFIKTRVRFMGILSMSTVAIFFIIRYVKTPLYDSYFVFLHPFILLMVSYVLFRIFEYKKILGFLVFGIMLTSLFLSFLREMKPQVNTLYDDVILGTSLLTRKYPNQHFSVYDYEYKSAGYSLPLSAYLSFQGLISESGIPIGIKISSPSSALTSDFLIGTPGGYELLEIRPDRKSDDFSKRWLRVNPSDVYRSTEEWYASGE